jgi:5-methylcytosine-specific restriction endonuclease McrA
VINYRGFLHGKDGMTPSKSRAKKQRLRMAKAALVRKEVRARDGQQCQCCHIPVFLDCANPMQRAEVHHIKFRSQGGPDTQRNLITVCGECHGKIHRHEVDLVGDALSVRFVWRVQ